MLDVFFWGLKASRVAWTSFMQLLIKIRQKNFQQYFFQFFVIKTLDPDPYSDPTFWCGSGSGSVDPCLWLMDPDPDSDPEPAIFVIDLQGANKKLNFLNFFSAYYFLKVHLHKKSKRSHKTVGIKVFLTIFGTGARSESIPLTNRSRSWRP